MPFAFELDAVESRREPGHASRWHALPPAALAALAPAYSGDFCPVAIPAGDRPRRRSCVPGSVVAWVARPICTILAPNALSRSPLASARCETDSDSHAAAAATAPAPSVVERSDSRAMHPAARRAMHACRCRCRYRVSGTRAITM